jgi:hypothetical protein
MLFIGVSFSVFVASIASVFVHLPVYFEQVIQVNVAREWPELTLLDP